MPDLFDSIGQKVEQISTGPTQNGTNGVPAEEEEDDQKVVEEIESLCMNCHENVSYECFPSENELETDILG
jgi:zinc finger protein